MEMQIPGAIRCLRAHPVVEVPQQVAHEAGKAAELDRMVGVWQLSQLDRET